MEITKASTVAELLRAIQDGGHKEVQVSFIDQAEDIVPGYVKQTAFCVSVSRGESATVKKPQ